MGHDPAVNQFEALLREHVDLAPLTTLRVGGEARFFAEVDSSDQLLAGIRWAAGQGLQMFVLGGGSNIIVSDRGFPGLVMRIGISGIQVQPGIGGSMLLTAGAGEQWDDVVKRAVGQNLAGLECLSGIPGSVGATPIQNVGAYGQEISETMVRLAALDTVAGDIAIIESTECDFGYRTSRFKTTDKGRFIITSVTYRLHLDGEPAVRYEELRRYLEERGRPRPTLAETREAVLTIRRAKAMVIDPADPDSRSVGSFFVNPVVTPATLRQIEKRLIGESAKSGTMPSFATQGGLIKLSAGWLIERAGFARGYRYGRVGVSSKHPLAIVAGEGGTAAEIMELAGKIQERVWDAFGVRLVAEPTFVGLE